MDPLPPEVVEPNICWLCGFEFSQKDELNLHLNSSGCNHTAISSVENNMPHISLEDSTQILRKSFYYSNNLLYNTVNKPIIKKHSCSYCFKQFTRKDHLRRHWNTCKPLSTIMEQDIGIKAEVERQRFLCELCKKVFTRRDHLRRHTTTACGPVDINVQCFICLLCGSKFLVKDRLIRHLYSTNRHVSNVQYWFRCEFCNFKVGRKDKLQAHLRRHFRNRQQIHKCKLCNTIFDSFKDLSYHVSKNSYPNKKRIRSCCLCKVVYSTKADVWNHLHNENETMLYMCFICSSVYTMKTDLEIHIRVEHFHKEVRVKLESVDIIENENTTLLEQYIKEEPLCCDVCDYVLLDRDSYIIHKQTHNISSS